MKLFEKFFGSQKQSAVKPSVGCNLIAASLDCPYEYIPEGAKCETLSELFDAAVAEGREQGYYPVLIATREIDLAMTIYKHTGLWDILADVMEREDGMNTINPDFAFGEKELQTLREYRAKLIHAWKESDADDFLEERISQYIENDDEFDLEKDWGGAKEGILFDDTRRSISVPFSDTFKCGKELLLAKIPVSEPWQIAAWLPMGGWNECPAPKELLAMAKHWYEKYGAVICCVSSAALEFRVSNPPADFEQAYKLAKEQFYFCEDRVWQYAPKYNLRTLANGLTQSPYWYFWWD